MDERPRGGGPPGGHLHNGLRLRLSAGNPAPSHSESFRGTSRSWVGRVWMRGCVKSPADAAASRRTRCGSRQAPDHVPWRASRTMRCPPSTWKGRRRCASRWLRKRGIRHRIARKGIESSQRLGRHRWVAERTVSWPAGCRRLHRRHERKAEHSSPSQASQQPSSATADSPTGTTPDHRTRTGATAVPGSANLKVLTIVSTWSTLDTCGRQSTKRRQVAPPRHQEDQWDSTSSPSSRRST
jgi:hypothetical protein